MKIDEKTSDNVLELTFKPEMIPLNSELYSDFSIGELEERLEIDKPWGGCL